MSVFTRAFAGGFLGRVTGALLIAICLALGFGPDKWAEFFLYGLTQWVTPSVARIVFFAIALTTAALLIGPYLIRRFSRQPALEGPSARVDLSVAAPSVASNSNKDSDKDSEAQRLAGLVRAISNKVLEWDFSPVPAGHPFITNWNDLRSSIHPVWADKRVNQLREEFTHACGCLAAANRDHDAKETFQWRPQVNLWAERLIDALKGGKPWEPRDDDELESASADKTNLGVVWKVPAQAIEAFGSQELIAQRTDLLAQREDALKRGNEAENMIAGLRARAKCGDYNTVQSAHRAIEKWRKKLGEAAADSDQAARKLRGVIVGLETQIVQLLGLGRLIGKAFAYPNSGRDEEIVAKSRWRDLEIDFVQMTAKRRHDGAVVFTSLLIGKPPAGMPSTRRE